MDAIVATVLWGMDLNRSENKLAGTLSGGNKRFARRCRPFIYGIVTLWRVHVYTRPMKAPVSLDFDVKPATYANAHSVRPLAALKQHAAAQMGCLARTHFRVTRLSASQLSTVLGCA